MLDLRDVEPLRPKRAHYDLDAVVAGLRATAARWVPRHFPQGRRLGPEWRLANIQGERARKQGSCVIALEGERAGDWIDFDTNQGGGPLNALEHATRRSGRELIEYAAGLAGSVPVEQIAQGRAPRERAEGTAREIAFILSRAGPVAGTPVESYLAARGLPTPNVPDLLFHPDLTYWDTRTGYPAMVAVVRNGDAKPTALHRTYLAPDGAGKADVPKPRMMLGPVAGGAVGLAPVGEPAVLGLAEGIETALSVMQACPQLPVWAALSAGNMERAALPPEVTRVVLLADHDAAGAGRRAAERAAAKLSSEGRRVWIAVPPREGDDFNDLFCREGVEAVRSVVEAAVEWRPSPELSAPPPHEPPTSERRQRVVLKIGSDVEIAARAARQLVGTHGDIVYCDGFFWRYVGTHWQAFSEPELRLAVHPYDGAFFRTPAGEPSIVKLSKSRIDSAINEMGTLLASPDFFAEAPLGINCASGFISFDRTGSPRLDPHRPDHRARHVLAGQWPLSNAADLRQGSLLERLLHGCFKDDGDMAEKIDLLAEAAGGAALGYATKLIKPKAIVLKGATAENGKSQILDMMRGLLPPSATSSLALGKFGDERYAVQLVSKLLNASDELSSAAAIASDAFKQIVTGEPVSARDVYRSAVTFRPVAQHVFATNDLPSFRGGMDRGVQRRLLVVTFNRTVPEEERIEHIGIRITHEEIDLLLDWAVAGASRLIRRRAFAEPPSSKAALQDWILNTDPVLSWIDACVTVETGPGAPRVPTSEAYEAFRRWATAEGHKEANLPGINKFSQRVKAAAKGVTPERDSGGRYLVGIWIERGTGAYPGDTW